VKIGSSQGVSKCNILNNLCYIDLVLHNTNLYLFLIYFNFTYFGQEDFIK